MLVKTFGGFDIIAGIIAVLFGAGFPISKSILFFIAIILIIKSLFGFFKDFASLSDFSAGLVLILSTIFPFLKLLNIITGLIIIQKGIVSFL